MSQKSQKKYVMPSKSLKNIARSGLYTTACASRVQLWMQSMKLETDGKSVREDKCYFESTLRAAAPKGEDLDAFFSNLPNVPFVDIEKGDYDLVENLETTKVLYAIYQTTQLKYGASIPILVKLLKSVPLDTVSIFRLIRKLILISRESPGLYLDLTLNAAVLNAKRLEATLQQRVSQEYTTLVFDKKSSSVFTMLIVDCFRSFVKKLGSFSFLRFSCDATTPCNTVNSHMCVLNKPILNTAEEQLRFLDIFFAEGSKAFYRFFLGLLITKRDSLANTKLQLDSLRTLSTDINIEVILQTGFGVRNFSRTHIAETQIDAATMAQMVQHLKTIPTFGCSKFIPIDYSITRTDRSSQRKGKKSITHKSALLSIHRYVQILKWLPDRFQAVRPKLVYTSSVDGFGLDRLRELSFGVGPSLILFKTAGRMPNSEGVAEVGTSTLPDDIDVTFGVFVAGKWTYDMVKKDVEGDGLAGDSYFLFRLDPLPARRVILSDDDETTVMGGETGARKSDFYRVMTTRSGISFGCHTCGAGSSSAPALYIDKNFQSGSSAPYSSAADARDIVFDCATVSNFRIQCIELISLAY